MIIHSFFTDGMYPWGLLFLRSFQRANGRCAKIVLSTRDLSEQQIKQLYAVYPNLEVRNERLDMLALAERTGQSLDALNRMKKNTEHGDFSLLWKQFISVEDRYRRSIIEVLSDHLDSAFSHLLHIDIDMYFRGNVDSLFDLIRTNDISIHFRSEGRIGRDREDKKLMGALIGFRLDKSVFPFFENWHRHIDSLPLIKKPLGFGQTTLYRAYLDTKYLYKWGNIPLQFADPSREPNALIWAGNRGPKESSLRLFLAEFEQGVTVPSNPHFNLRKDLDSSFENVLKRHRNGKLLRIGLAERFHAFEKLVADHELAVSEIDVSDENEAARNGMIFSALQENLKKNRTFDIVYFSGELGPGETYATVFSALPLLAPGSSLVLDNVEDGVSRQKNMKKARHGDLDFDPATPPLHTVLYRYLLPLFNLVLDSASSSSDFVALKVPASGLSARFPTAGE